MIAWNELFKVEVPGEKEAGGERKIPRDCCEVCLMAREIKCVCKCGGRNHGAWLKVAVKPLDQFKEFNGELRDVPPELAKTSLQIDSETLGNRGSFGER